MNFVSGPIADIDQAIRAKRNTFRILQTTEKYTNIITGATVEACAFLIELQGLGGADKISRHEKFVLLEY